MRFSDMMGSGEERTLKSSENDNAVSDALAPYLDSPILDTPTPAETAVAVEAAVDAAVEAAREAAADHVPEAPPSRAHTVESVFPVIPVPADAIAPAPPAAPVAPAPVAAHDSIAAIPDFTPLSDDLLPRRKR
jgi:pyruvate dehydrogenase E2 component (dihydrolipoamide acetyltransferase)